MSDTQNVTAAWQKRAPWLARWTLAHLANRTELWIRYLPAEKRKDQDGRAPALTRLAPLPSRRGNLQLNERVLARHYRGEDPGHVLGVHSASSNQTSRWIAIDLESHENQVPLHNLKAATHWRDELISLGFRPLLIDSDGKGGYHLLVLFRQPLPTARAFDFAQTLTRDHADFGLERTPVILPNGPTANDNSWLRLPGRHPVTDHWSRVWNGRRWLEGSDAVEAVLHLHGDSSTLIRKLTATAAIGAAPTDGALAAPAAGEAVPHGGMGSTRVNPAVPPVSGWRGQSGAASGVAVSSTVLERQILSYLLAATRQNQEAAAFAAVAAADVSNDAFKTPIHREVFNSLQHLYGHSERITPTTIAERLPQEERPEALAVIDKIILEKPVEEEEFEDLLEALGHDHSSTTAPAPLSLTKPPVENELADVQRDLLLQTWSQLSPSVRHSLVTLALACRKLG